MKIEIVGHARQRMAEYDVPEDLVVDTVQSPDSIQSGHGGRTIYQKELDGHVLRVIVEELPDTRTVITVYRARSGRYGI